MLTIRRLFSSVHEEETLRQVQAIFRDRFPSVSEYADKIPLLLEDPFQHGYRSVLLVAEKGLGHVVGFSLLLYFPEIRACLLDYIAVGKDFRAGGLGSALYESTRGYAISLKARGLYLEALPDDKTLEPDPKTRAENARRLKFYERYGVRPIVGTAYETPFDVTEDHSAPYLLFDGLGRTTPLKKKEARDAVRLILQRKYGHVAPEGYIDNVVASFRDDPVRIRESRYVSTNENEIREPIKRFQSPFAVVSSTRHALHHVKDRGYVERPARVRALMESIEPLGIFESVAPRHFPESVLRGTHQRDFVTYLKQVCQALPEGARPVYPYVFPIRRPERKPKDRALRAGYYCIDTFTPLSRNSYEAARAAVDVVLTGAEELKQGRRVVYAICRPPGHHAERRVFGGFCYFNNAAMAAHRLTADGSRVALLDIDFHHGNGSQDIFYDRSDVLFVSIHGHPHYAYPYFSGYSDERGAGEGFGYNRNFPLPDGCTQERYLKVLSAACSVISKYRPDWLVVSLGFDIMKGDPTGGFLLEPSGMAEIGRMLAELRLPILFVQEGGYSIVNLRSGSRALFRAMAAVMV